MPNANFKFDARVHMDMLYRTWSFQTGNIGLEDGRKIIPGRLELYDNERPSLNNQKVTIVGIKFLISLTAFDCFCFLLSMMFARRLLGLEYFIESNAYTIAQRQFPSKQQTFHLIHDRSRSEIYFAFQSKSLRASWRFYDQKLHIMMI